MALYTDLVVVGIMVFIAVMFAVWVVGHTWIKDYFRRRSMKGSNSGVIIAVLVILIIFMALMMWGVLIIDWSKVLI